MAAGRGCEDFAMVAPLGLSRYALAVADGAGSARHGAEGARIACLTAIHALKSGEPLEGVASCCRRALNQSAAALDEHVSNWATTLLVASLALTPSGILVRALQIGDGVILQSSGSRAYALTTPQRGEFANQTTFLTSPDWGESVQYRRLRLPAAGGVVLLTDGPMSALYRPQTGEVAPAAQVLLDWGRRGSTQQWKADVQQALDDSFANMSQDDLGVAAALIPSLSGRASEFFRSRPS